jgi:hypothetical protein
MKYAYILNIIRFVDYLIHSSKPQATRVDVDVDKNLLLRATQGHISSEGIDR